MSEKSFFVTTPIYYVNDVPHIGHSYTTIAADVLARYHKLCGRDVFFLTGTDEHGVKIQQSAGKVGMSPKELCDGVAEKFKDAWRCLNIEYDNFIRTTDSHHEEAVKQVLQTLYDKGYIYKGKYEALYCVGCEQFKMKSDLVDGKCPDHKIEPEERSEECYLFKLSAFQDELYKQIKSDKFKILPLERKNEVLSFIENEGLQDISISRDKTQVYWGIPLPFDPSHTTYVWVDAFLNYLTGLGWPQDKDNFMKFWPPTVQLMAKDISRVHATIWVSILMALEIELPQMYFIHGYFTVNGQKMSKSLKNVIDPVALSEKYGADVIRYFILSEFPFGTDGNFSIKRLEEAYNSDLANDFGNLIHRTIPMIDKYCGGVTPTPKGEILVDEELKKVAEDVVGVLEELFGELKFREVLAEIWKIIKRANKYIDESAPWTLFKEGDNERLNTVMYNILESVRIVTILVYPFMPETSQKIWGQLGVTESLNSQNIPRDVVWGGLKPGTKIKKETPLFPRIELNKKG
ncbi:methionine--tRNA ligase [Candidatus Oleimmundimicrobium sp.]|uniref:methionine--tRNA ligase n=1 Tax=Candidatus Oleimmundimicrobium sp. TaxID=3060597 RepID=UPI00271A687A|nr:methionine--tRNA ligase [Candidatus Oleimmundimicrobium sp.]MDO8886310.1 methionine--tRNA ligase [Candidatus Oleimmundimicrobium sp.]